MSKFPAAISLATLSDYIYMLHPTERIEHITAFVTPAVENWLERGFQKCPSGKIDQTFHFW